MEMAPAVPSARGGQRDRANGLLKGSPSMVAVSSPKS
jgi:hypothetical protein